MDRFKIKCVRSLFAPNARSRWTGCAERTGPDAYGGPARDGRNLCNEKASLTMALITKLLLTNPLAKSRSGANAGDESRLKDPPSQRLTVDGIEEVKFESPEPHLLRRLSEIRPQHAPNINARGYWDRRSPWRGWFTLQPPAPKPDKQHLINSQAVYRPSLVENSRVTMSSVE
jgi:hypothetical protein